jgi:dienelactone hydrolase
VPEAVQDVPIRESGSSEVAVKDDAADLDKIDQALMAYDLSDDALEAAASIDGGRAITVGYCATAGSAWYCLPF